MIRVIENEQKNYLFIEQFNSKSMSLTNNIDNVLSDISKGRSLDGKRVFYRDTEGIIDEVTYEEKNQHIFNIGFKYRGFKTEDDIISFLG